MNPLLQPFPRRATAWILFLLAVMVPGLAGATFDSLKAEAETGDPDAVTALALAYYQGEGTDLDFERALELFESVARQSPDAAYYLGRMHALGEGTRTDAGEAARWWKRAVREDHTRALNNLAYFYEKGIEVRQDYEEAMDLYAEAAAAGHVPAMTRLGFLNETGLGVGIDMSKAIDWYSQAVEADSTDAIGNLGSIYWSGRQGPDAGPDYEQALALFRQGAALGDARSQHHLGLAYRDGKGVQADPEQAVAYFRKAAGQGLPMAANVLGAIYLEGRLGLPQDRQKALELFRIASRDPAFAANLKETLFLLELEFGDREQVIADLEAAATEARDFDSALLLNRIYAEGLGLPKDPEKAQRWGLLVDEIIMEQIGM